MYCPRCGREVKGLITKVYNTDETNIRCSECYELISCRNDAPAVPY